ncbi:MAG: cytochrome c3 family protein [Coriobacteriia bacterium]
MGRFERLGIAMIGAMVFALVFALASPAFGYKEPNNFNGSGCNYCHDTVTDLYRLASGACEDCHASYPDTGYAPGYQRGEWYGPHGGYTTGSSKCRVCHSVHQAPATGVILLKGATVTATCFSCHDGTGSGFGVYGTILGRTGIDPQDGNAATPGAAHRMVNATNVIPGGDALTGGTALRTFSGTGGVLACNDCHSVHGALTVDPFKGDRKRVRGEISAPVTDRLLRKRPTGASLETTAYGSDWCAGCHAGRMSGGTVVNHPVDSGVGAFTYSRVSILSTVSPTATTVFAPLGGVPFAGGGHSAAEPDNSGNRGYLMPWPRTVQQGAHKPICQQCHEDSRSVGSLDATGTIGDATTAQIAAGDNLVWNGSAWVISNTDNPRFQNFPHEAANNSFLVEPSDDLCMNCHPMGQLP